MQKPFTSFAHEIVSKHPTYQNYLLRHEMGLNRSLESSQDVKNPFFKLKCEEIELIYSLLWL